MIFFFIWSENHLKLTEKIQRFPKNILRFQSFNGWLTPRPLQGGVKPTPCNKWFYNSRTPKGIEMEFLNS